MQCHLPTTGMHVLDITEVVVHVLILLSDVHVHTCTAAWKIIGTKSTCIHLQIMT